jgi:uncharacterized protein (DUF1919 family)
MNHETKIQQIELEMTEIKSQILKLEFQHKKDIKEAEKRFDDRNDKIQRQLDYITKLAGVTYQELDLLDEKLVRSGQVAASPRKRI